MPPVEEFIAKWQPSGGSELGSSQAFLIDLCHLLEVPLPDPPRPETAENAYTFERRVMLPRPDGKTAPGRIDLYKRGCFIEESKQGSDAKSKDKPLSRKEEERARDRRTGTAVRGTRGWDEAMMRARAQAEGYVRALPADEGRPPFLLIVDVGYSIEVYAEFTCSGGVYTPFPNPREHRILLEDIRKPDIRERLRRIWLDPLSLDPSRISEKVTNDIAIRLERLAKSLEDSGHDPEEVAMFLMRCIFTMFAEDVELLPAGSFTAMLEKLQDAPEHFADAATDLWKVMKTGGFSSFLMKKVLRFNGHLFESATALPLNRDQLALLQEASAANWADVESSIFGTLLERALSPKERHKLGAHYTPSAYVERLVIPTLIDPLREEWDNVKAAALTHVRAGDHKAAIKEVQDFHKHLCEVQVLDPAAGSGNFLFTSLNLLKDLEGEVLAALRDLGQGRLDFEGQGYAVGPHQFHGIEYNPRAAAISELVLWLSYLQRHYRNNGRVNPPEPILKDFKSIECRDAVLAYDRTEEVIGDDGKPVRRWDGETYKKHPTTGKDIPNETALIPVLRYINPRPADPWPKADYIVGNPPFIGNKRMRMALGDGYVDALRAAIPEVPESADYVMYWWNRAAELTVKGEVKRFGLITTNSLRQAYNRKVIERYMEGEPPLSLLMAIPDHPWVDAANGAQVRIAMTVATAGHESGVLSTAILERPADGFIRVDLDDRIGRINSNLTVGLDMTRVRPLKANEGLCGKGMTVSGNGFKVTSEEAVALGLGRTPGLEKHIRPYMNGRDVARHSRGILLIDLYGLSLEEIKARYPEVYAWIVDRVKPNRAQHRTMTVKNAWWVFERPRPDLRRALSGLPRYIVTVETARRRYFVFLDESVLPDIKLLAFASDDAYTLGVLSSRIHCEWALATGARLGVGNDPVYVKTVGFDAFPFPDATEAQKQTIRDIAERLDTHRQERMREHPNLALTDIYAALEKLRYGVHFTDKEKKLADQSDLSTLKQLHDDLDAAVAAAYGWPANLSTEAILERLLALNATRAEEEEAGQIRWLRPDFQSPQEAQQAGLDLEADEPAHVDAQKLAAVTPAKQPWPKTLAEQTKAVRVALTFLARPARVDDISSLFVRPNQKRIAEILESLESMGMVISDGGLFINL